MIDAPGPWGSGPFILTEGFSGLEAEIALISSDPFVCVWLPTALPRSDRVVLEAFTDHWNTERGPRLERIVFRNDIAPARALDLVCDSVGEVDIVTEVSPADAHDPEAARSLLADAGWPDGRALRLAAPFDVEGIGRHIADQLSTALGAQVDLTVIGEDELLAAQQRLIGNVLPLPFDVLLHAWFDLASDAPPAVLHREFFHSSGAFVTGEHISELEDAFGRFVAQTEPYSLTEGRRRDRTSTSTTRPLPCSSKRRKPSSR